MELSQEQRNALKCILSGENVFLTGEAGTGKSTVLQELRRLRPEDAVFLAPTGIAAIRLGGSTLHSFFLFPLGLLTPESLEELPDRRHAAVIRNAKILVIDEISMVRSDLFLGVGTSGFAHWPPGPTACAPSAGSRWSSAETSSSSRQS